MGQYIYDSHLGGLYTSEEPIPVEWLYCDSCGDSDLQLGFCETREEAKETIEALDIYTDEYIQEFLDENFPEDGDKDG